MSEMSPFENELLTLVARELPHAARNPDHLAHMLERMCSSVGLMIAVGARGVPAQIDELAAGAEAFIHGTAVEKAALGRALAAARTSGDQP